MLVTSCGSRGRASSWTQDTKRSKIQVGGHSLVSAPRTSHLSPLDSTHFRVSTLRILSTSLTLTLITVMCY